MFDCGCSGTRSFVGKNVCKADEFQLVMKPVYVGFQLFVAVKTFVEVDRETRTSKDGIEPTSSTSKLNLIEG